MPRTPLLAAALALVAGCRTTVVERPLAQSAEVHTAAPARAWQIVEAGAVVGRVVYFEASGRPEASVYMVQNAWDQDLGMIDCLGRAWRYRPHEREAKWLSTGTVAEGAAGILGAGDACQLREIALAESEAPAR